MTHSDKEFMSRTDLRAALAAALIGLAVHAAPLFSQTPLPPVPPKPGVPTPVTKPPLAKPVLQPVMRPGQTMRGAVAPVIPVAAPELEDQRAKGAAPTGVRVTASSPFAASVAWQEPTCAAGSRIYIGLAADNSSRKVFETDTLSREVFKCAGAIAARGGKELGVAGDASSAGANSLKHTVDFLQPGTTYFFKVTAFYRDSAPGSAVAVSATLPPPPPITMATVRPSPKAVYLEWHTVPRVSSYRVYRDNVLLAEIGARSGTSAPPDTTYQDIGVKPAASYSYRVDGVFQTVYWSSGVTISERVVSVTVPVKTPYPVIVGFADTHTHPFANLASGGALFWGAAFGPEAAVMGLCEPIHGFAGLKDLIGTVERDMNEAVGVGHKTGGYPNYDGWPKWNTLDHQQMYSDWILRAHEGGLRLIVAFAVNNGLLCSLVPKAQGRSCDDMEAADLQIAEAKKMENFIDLQSGGPGRGWFRIAYTPEQARQIIGDGKLAVVLGIEVDKLFDCNQPLQGTLSVLNGRTCNADTVDAQLARYYQMGVRHLFPVHIADNAFGGFALTGSTLFKLNSMAANPGGITQLGAPVLEEPCAGYSHKCNQKGLTPLGEHLITSMMNRGMIIDVDHMSKRTTDAVFALTSPRQYPLIGGHTGFVQTSPGDNSEREKSESQLVAMKKDGGMVSVGLTPGETGSYTPSWRGPVANDCVRTSKGFAQSYLYAVDKMGGPDVAAVGVATDQFLNPLMGPRFDNHCPNQGNRVLYPLKPRPGSGLVQLINSRSGNRTFDYNTDGLAHVGLLPDFVQDLKNIGLTDRDLDPLYRSAEGYIQLWERAVARSVLP
ncbi:MAG: membrane dipeptidase [Gemmatimonadota bacterium]|nr:membrane dipeptidase [Gemmatimonadota bacterium]